MGGSRDGNRIGSYGLYKRNDGGDRLVTVCKTNKLPGCDERVVQKS